MTTSPGTRLGPYEIVSRIGAGGMGEVFRARDTRLDRSVAVKVLPQEFRNNAQLRLRFEREAKAISQLNHPHICTLYDVGEDYLVMELLEGETLADRLNRGPLALPDVLKIGAQIADALDRAHRAGIVHRDLKPGNIMLTKAGAKLLDFGLAKTAVQQINPNDATVQHDKALTQEGTILGTFQYMAPEQLEAEEADARTDIFALGAVLYEMATGKRAFAGKTKTSLIAAIVGAQPQPVSQLIPLSPPALDHVIQKCLEKERDDRWQSAHDVAEELKWIATIPIEANVQRTRTAKLVTVAAVLLALALAGVTAMWLRTRNAPKPRAAFAILPPDGYYFTNHMLSPDGTMIVFSANNAKNEGGLFLRRVDAIEAKRLTSSYLDVPLAWSPDSKWIAYYSNHQTLRQVKKIAISGGTPEVILARGAGTSGLGTWGADGTILHCRIFGEGLSAIKNDSERFVTTLDPKRRESFHGWPQFLPDGERFLYVVHTVADVKNEIWAGSLDGKLKKQILRADSLVGVANGRLYFVRDGAIYAQKFDAGALELSGEPRRVIEHVAFSESNISALAHVGINGALLYMPVAERRVEFGWYDLTGRRIEKVFEDLDLFPVSLSRDGSKVAALKFDHVKGANDVYIIDVTRDVRTRLTGGLANNDTPLWAPGGDRIYFTSDRDGPYAIYSQAEDGASPATLVWKSDRDKSLFDVSPSGDALLASDYSAETRQDVWLVPTAEPEKRRVLVAGESLDYAAKFSPDGKWFAYISDRSGRPELYMRRLEGGRTTQISTGGTNGYMWNETGSAVYLRTQTRDRVSIPLTFNGDQVVAGKPVLMFAAPALEYGIVAVTKKGLAMYTIPEPSDYISLLHYDSAPPVE
jgi:eukaryotic-like serine/threonine-protein kinase